VSAVIAAVLVAPATVAQADGGASAGERPTFADCGFERAGDGVVKDYRSRNSDPQLRWSIADIDRNHYEPAVSRMRSGERTERVISDLNYLLQRWPNHYPGLQAIIEYESRGGRFYGYPSAQCYFVWAHENYADDSRVLMMEAYYYWKKKGDKRAAIFLYEEALAVDPTSVDLQYNLGLVYFDTGDYTKSLEHAWVAYDGGYPLPGLRKKLEGAGAWRDSPRSAETAIP
jgi:tetratricopeptide (TPR) repeat protein